MPTEVVLPKPVEPERDPLIDLHDEVDETVLSIFLEEAGELFPQAGEQVRGWRRAPADTTMAQQLRRTLHTFKGSARMAGAMRLGELTHRMESRLMDGDSLPPATPELFEALDTDLDHIGYVLDALREGRSNVALPWLDRPARPAAATPRPQRDAMHRTRRGRARSPAAAPARRRRRRRPTPLRAEPPMSRRARGPCCASTPTPSTT